jgi:tRNA pseudouridine38-40 synthase
MRAFFMNKYKLIIAYDGTDYAGWIQQPHQPSIVQTLHDSFANCFGKKIKLLGASKTDAGVHALGQVAVFSTDLAITPEKLKWAWNNALPPSVMIRSLTSALTFNPHANVIEKTYYYHFFTERPLPFCARYGAYFSVPLDIKKFEHSLTLFKGTHDFHAFYTGNDREDTIRTIKEIRLEYIKRYNAYRVIVIGERFLRHMVRRIVGAALAGATRESITAQDIRNALERRAFNCELPLAPAQGLLLYKIRYKT